MSGSCPDYDQERLAALQGARRIVGVDEVGRGPLCGPVTAAAVWLDPDTIPPGLGDSKRLSAARRAVLFAQLQGMADIGIGHASVAEIDALNILQASYLAMRRAIAALALPPDFALIDGNRLPPDLPCAARAVVKGDARVLSIAAASIIAKVTRDAIMADLARRYPGYGWEQNAGYPTKRHINAIADLGLTPEHRRSFKPIRNIL
ncbi:MAG: ribonuclease HII [Rhodobacteraceae bacterium]|nr:ribonuclease HII [Paracoccaceae bacterium]